MPHFGLMNPEEMKRVDAALLRAKLHIRGGERRLNEDKISAGVAALYDAVICALEYSVLFLESENKIEVFESDDLSEERDLFNILKRSKIINENFTNSDFDFLYNTLDKTLEGDVSDFNRDDFMQKINDLMTQLGVLPFSYDELPVENPSTY